VDDNCDPAHGNPSAREEALVVDVGAPGCVGVVLRERILQIGGGIEL